MEEGDPVGKRNEFREGGSTKDAEREAKLDQFSVNLCN